MKEIGLLIILSSRFLLNLPTLVMVGFLLLYFFLTLGKFTIVIFVLVLTRAYARYIGAAVQIHSAITTDWCLSVDF